ncbi:MAG TPA: cytochrome c family protein [Xanthobacteraceae bacterium]|nr:cytochrome c family protein [Xanthobacteraceae bacterium]
MDSFEINKILGALLFTCLVLLSLNIAAGAMFAPIKPAKPGFEVAVTEHPAGGEQPKAEPEEPIEKLLASASVDKGANSAKKCQACHTFGKGEPNRVGPNLYGVVGRPKGSEAGFDYSAGMKSKGGSWTIDDLNAFLTNPKAFVPGTKMSFAGVPRGSERADVIAFLNTKSDSPQPLPKAAEAAPAPAAAPAAPPPAGQKK